MAQSAPPALRERLANPVWAELPQGTAPGDNVRWTGIVPVQLSMEGRLEPAFHGRHRPPMVHWEEAAVRIPSWAAAGTRRIDADEVASLEFTPKPPDKCEYEAARDARVAQRDAFVKALDIQADLEALRRSEQVTVRVRNAGDGGEGHGRGGRKRPAAARSDGKSGARKQRHRMAAASGHDALWPAVGHPSLRLSLVFREHQRGAGGVPGREDNATPVRLLPPAKVGKLDTLFALPGVWYAQQGVLAPNARALRDGTSKDAKPRGVHTVPVPEGILRGANSKHALGVLRAVDAASCALLGDGNTAVAYDLWLHSGQRSNRLLDAAFVSLGLYLPVMVTPTLFPFFPFTRSHFPLRTCVAGVGPRPACRDVYDIAFSCCTPSCDGHRQRQVGHLAAGVFGGLPRRGHRAHPGQNCKLLPTAATADTGPHQYPAVQLIGHLTGARTINRPSYGCAYN